MCVIYPNEIDLTDVHYAMNRDRGPASFVQSTIDILQQKGLLKTPYVILPEDHTEVVEKAIRDFISIPAHCRMRCMIVDLDQHEKRALAFISATIEVLSRKGFVNPKDIMGPAVYVASQEVIDEETYGGNVTPQKD